ncbi:CopG family transcriptional regulator [bacterium]|nr:CopG family transcriptional regulator [bacterium]
MKKVKAKDFDDTFDRGEDVTKYLDKSKARRVNAELKRVNIDFPVWVIDSLDKEARRLGITRQSLVKMWIAEKFKTDNQASE